MNILSTLLTKNNIRHTFVKVIVNRSEHFNIILAQREGSDMCPSIGVVIPTDGTKRTILKVVNNILRQDYEGRIKIAIIIGGKNVSLARNIGALLLKDVKLLHFIDDDVVPPPSALRKFVGRLLQAKQHSESVVSIVGVYGNWYGDYTVLKHPGILYFVSPPKRTHGMHGYILISRDAWKRVSGYPEVLEWGLEDRAFGILLERNNMIALCDPLIKAHHLRGTQNLSKQLKRIYRWNKAIPIFFFVTYAEGSLFKTYKLTLFNLICRYVLSPHKHTIANVSNTRQYMRPIHHMPKGYTILKATWAFLGLLTGFIKCLELYISRSNDSVSSIRYIGLSRVDFDEGPYNYGKVFKGANTSDI